MGRSLSECTRAGLYRRCVWHPGGNKVKWPTFNLPHNTERLMIEVNPTLLKIKDFSSRTDTLRGYL